MENKNNKERSKNNIAPLQIFLSCEIEDMIEEDIALENIDNYF